MSWASRQTFIAAMNEMRVQVLAAFLRRKGGDPQIEAMRMQVSGTSNREMLRRQFEKMRRPWWRKMLGG